jgi:hypothetical protein
MPHHRTTSTDLADLLATTAQRIADHGTRSESPTLTRLAAAARPLSPGAADALVDWEGSEVARLRAFGVVHGVLVRELGTRRDPEAVVAHRAPPMMVAV